ncbi:MAG: hypothetical protein KGI97_03065 [Alphaproteobacteria bacterium]|nr:hypothetical protein [Alphaproteobacteria bacterium]
MRQNLLVGGVEKNEARASGNLFVRQAAACGLRVGRAPFPPQSMAWRETPGSNGYPQAMRIWEISYTIRGKNARVFVMKEKAKISFMFMRYSLAKKTE